METSEVRKVVEIKECRSVEVVNSLLATGE